MVNIGPKFPILYVLLSVYTRNNYSFKNLQWDYSYVLYIDDSAGRDEDHKKPVETPGDTSGASGGDSNNHRILYCLFAQFYE